MDDAERAALLAATEAAKDQIAGILAGLGPYSQCEVTLFVRTPRRADDILMTSDNCERLLAAVQQRLSIPKKEKS